MPSRGVDPVYLHDQYGTAQKLRARIAAHQRYSENPASFVEWVTDRLDVRPGDQVLDAGAGPGLYTDPLIARGARIVALDMSAGMLRLPNDRSPAAARDRAAVIGDLQRLPFASGSLHRAMANHVLYHVPDIGIALRELRRVVRSPGRIVIATNHADHGRPLWEFHAQAARELGYRALAGGFTRFTLDDLSLVRATFPKAVVDRFDDAFMFPTAADALAYYASGPVDWIADPPAAAGHRRPLLGRMQTLIEDELERRGVFRVPKPSGCFTAEV